MRQRLRQAALELYHDQGFDQTTAAQIAARAGVTGRTFFRHFADKREVLFEEEAQRAALMAGLAAAPRTLAPLDALLWAFRSAEPLLEENRASAHLRREIIIATPALYERALAKAATLTNNLAAALRERGVEERLASLAAQIGMAACSEAVAAWNADPSQSFAAYLDRAFADLQTLTTPS
jgi:AcrR family transcriptional regulator